MDELRFPPPGACDCHVHVIGPKRRFPLVRERTYTPNDAPTETLWSTATDSGRQLLAAGLSIAAGHPAQS